MKRYPANMADFMDMFPTEDACLEYLSIVRWPDGYKCLRLLEEGSWPFHLPRMRVRGFSAGRPVVSGHPQTAPLMVSGDVVCGEPEKRRRLQRFALSLWCRFCLSSQRAQIHCQYTGERLSRRQYILYAVWVYPN